MTDIDIVTYFEKEQILVDFNNTLKVYPKDKCLHFYLEENDVKNPEKILQECLDFLKE